MKSLKVLLSTLLIVPALSAAADEVGKSSVTNTGKDGTSVTTEVTHSEVAGEDGKRSTSEVSTVVDPRGMMNREVAKTRVDREVKKNGDFAEKKVIDHANGTREEIAVDKSTAKNWTDKGTTETKTETRVVDPKGLGNKQVTEVQQKLEKNPDGSAKRIVTETVNGELVSKEIESSR